MTAAWNDLMVQRFHDINSRPGDPEVILSNGSIGLDLVLYYIRKNLRMITCCARLAN
jgi:hypothetical protein